MKIAIRIFEVPAGKWRVNLAAAGAASHTGGFDIERVELMGLRDKCWRLTQITRDDFNAVAPFQETNGEPLKPDRHLYGTPTAYYHQPRHYTSGRNKGYVIYLWPVPLTAWKLKVTYSKTEVVRGPHGWLESVRVE